MGNGTIFTFYSDLYVLLRQAEQVDADISVIIDNYKNSAGLAELTEEEMLVGRIFGAYRLFIGFLELQGTDNVPFMSGQRMNIQVC